MAKILKNSTGSNISIMDTGVTIVANSSYSIPAQDANLWAASSNIVTKIGSGDIIVNDGSVDLSISDGTDLIKGIYQKQRIIGNTDSTLIGNVGDKLKTYTTLDPSNSNPVKFEDGRFLDAFGRLRVSNPFTIFDCNFPFDKQPLVFSESTTSGGTVAHSSPKNAVVLTCTTTTNSRAIFQSRRYFKYHPSKSQLCIFTGNFKEYSANVDKYFGQFDANNGFFFKVTSTLNVGIRSKITGSVVDNVISQANWNLDKLDGTGSSGKTLDITKQQIFAIDYQWLGSGRVRFGFIIDGQLIYCHQFLHGNILETMYSQSADLPYRAEIKNNVSSTSTLELTCMSVISEGGYHPDAENRAVNNGATSRTFGTVGTQLPILALRKQSTYVTIPIEIWELGVFAPSTNDFLVEIIMNGTITGGTWTTAGVTGICEVNRSATSISGGTVIKTFYLKGTSQGGSLESGGFGGSKGIILGSDLGGVSDTISIVAVNLTQTAACLGYINYGELT